MIFLSIIYNHSLFDRFGSFSHISHPHLRRFNYLSFILSKLSSWNKRLTQDRSSFGVQCLWLQIKGILKIVKNIFQYLFVDKKKGVGSSVKRICHFASNCLFIDDIVDNRNDRFGEIVEVENRRKGIEANGMELVTILH